VFISNPASDLVCFTVMRTLFVLLKSYTQWVSLALNVPWTE